MAKSKRNLKSDPPAIADTVLASLAKMSPEHADRIEELRPKIMAIIADKKKLPTMGEVLCEMIDRNEQFAGNPRYVRLQASLRLRDLLEQFVDDAKAIDPEAAVTYLNGTGLAEVRYWLATIARWVTRVESLIQSPDAPLPPHLLRRFQMFWRARWSADRDPNRQERTALVYAWHATLSDDEIEEIQKWEAEHAAPE
jgi:hypothetical protein